MAQQLPPSEASCGSCFWGRVFGKHMLPEVRGVEVPELRPVLFCCISRPRIEVLAESICQDWTAQATQNAVAPFDGVTGT